MRLNTGNWIICSLTLTYLNGWLALTGEYFSSLITIVITTQRLAFPFLNVLSCRRKMAEGRDVLSCRRKIAEGLDVLSCWRKIAEGRDVLSCRRKIAEGLDVLSCWRKTDESSKGCKHININYFKLVFIVWNQMIDVTSLLTWLLAHHAGNSEYFTAVGSTSIRHTPLLLQPLWACPFMLKMTYLKINCLLKV